MIIMVVDSSSSIGVVPTLVVVDGVVATMDGVTVSVLVAVEVHGVVGLWVEVPVAEALVAETADVVMVVETADVVAVVVVVDVAAVVVYDYNLIKSNLSIKISKF